MYYLNSYYFIYKNCWTFQKKRVVSIGVFKFENFHLLETLFSFFLPFHRLHFKKFIFYIRKLLKISEEKHWAIRKGDWCSEIWKFSSFGNAFFHFFALFTVYNLKNSHLTYEICGKFQQNHFIRYSKGIGVFKFENFHLLETLF